MNRSSSTGRNVLPLRERLKGETQRAILEAAEEAFGQSGLNGARMDDIAARAGVSVGTLYNHFSDRDALLKALIVQRDVCGMSTEDGVELSLWTARTLVDATLREAAARNRSARQRASRRAS